MEADEDLEDLYNNINDSGENINQEWQREVGLDETSHMTSLDLYDDLITDEVLQEQQTYDELEERYGEALLRIHELEKQLEKTRRYERMHKQKCEVLEKNISLLYVTAKSELDRKEEKITELREELSTLCDSNSTHPKNRYISLSKEELGQTRSNGHHDKNKKTKSPAHLKNSEGSRKRKVLSSWEDSLERLNKRSRLNTSNEKSILNSSRERLKLNTSRESKFKREPSVIRSLGIHCEKSRDSFDSARKLVEKSKKDLWRRCHNNQGRSSSDTHQDKESKDNQRSLKVDLRTKLSSSRKYSDYSDKTSSKTKLHCEQSRDGFESSNKCAAKRKRNSRRNSGNQITSTDCDKAPYSHSESTDSSSQIKSEIRKVSESPPHTHLTVESFKDVAEQCMRDNKRKRCEESPERKDKIQEKLELNTSQSLSLKENLIQKQFELPINFERPKLVIKPGSDFNIPDKTRDSSPRSSRDLENMKSNDAEDVMVKVNDAKFKKYKEASNNEMLLFSSKDTQHENYDKTEESKLSVLQECDKIQFSDSKDQWSNIKTETNIDNALKIDKEINQTLKESDKESVTNTLIDEFMDLDQTGDKEICEKKVIGDSLYVKENLENSKKDLETDVKYQPDDTKTQVFKLPFKIPKPEFCDTTSTNSFDIKIDVSDSEMHDLLGSENSRDSYIFGMEDSRGKEVINNHESKIIGLNSDRNNERSVSGKKKSEDRKSRKDKNKQKREKKNKQNLNINQKERQDGEKVREETGTKNEYIDKAAKRESQESEKVRKKSSRKSENIDIAARKDSQDSEKIRKESGSVSENIEKESQDSENVRKESGSKSENIDNAARKESQGSEKLRKESGSKSENIDNAARKESQDSEKIRKESGSDSENIDNAARKESRDSEKIRKESGSESKNTDKVAKKESQDSENVSSRNSEDLDRVARNKKTCSKTKYGKQENVDKKQRNEEHNFWDINQNSSKETDKKVLEINSRKVEVEQHDQGKSDKDANYKDENGCEENQEKNEQIIEHPELTKNLIEKHTTKILKLPLCQQVIEKDNKSDSTKEKTDSLSLNWSSITNIEKVFISSKGQKIVLKSEKPEKINKHKISVDKVSKKEYEADLEFLNQLKKKYSKDSKPDERKSGLIESVGLPKLVDVSKGFQFSTSKDSKSVVMDIVSTNVPEASKLFQNSTSKEGKSAVMDIVSTNVAEASKGFQNSTLMERKSAVMDIVSTNVGDASKLLQNSTSKEGKSAVKDIVPTNVADASKFLQNSTSKEGKSAVMDIVPTNVAVASKMERKSAVTNIVSTNVADALEGFESSTSKKGKSAVMDSLSKLHNTPKAFHTFKSEGKHTGIEIERSTKLEDCSKEIQISKTKKVKIAEMDIVPAELTDAAKGFQTSEIVELTSAKMIHISKELQTSQYDEGSTDLLKDKKTSKLVNVPKKTKRSSVNDGQPELENVISRELQTTKVCERGKDVMSNIRKCEKVNVQHSSSLIFEDCASQSLPKDLSRGFSLKPKEQESDVTKSLESSNKECAINDLKPIDSKDMDCEHLRNEVANITQRPLLRNDCSDPIQEKDLSCDLNEHISKPFKSYSRNKKKQPNENHSKQKTELEGDSFENLLSCAGDRSEKCKNSNMSVQSHLTDAIESNMCKEKQLTNLKESDSKEQREFTHKDIIKPSHFNSNNKTVAMVTEGSGTNDSYSPGRLTIIENSNESQSTVSKLTLPKSPLDKNDGSDVLIKDTSPKRHFAQISIDLIRNALEKKIQENTGMTKKCSSNNSKATETDEIQENNTNTVLMEIAEENSDELKSKGSHKTHCLFMESTFYGKKDECFSGEDSRRSDQVMDEDLDAVHRDVHSETESITEFFDEESQLELAQASSLREKDGINVKKCSLDKSDCSEHESEGEIQSSDDSAFLGDGISENGNIQCKNESEEEMEVSDNPAYGSDSSINDQVSSQSLDESTEESTCTSDECDKNPENCVQDQEHNHVLLAENSIGEGMITNTDFNENGESSQKRKKSLHRKNKIGESEKCLRKEKMNKTKTQSNRREKRKDSLVKKRTRSKCPDSGRSRNKRGDTEKKSSSSRKEIRSTTSESEKEGRNDSNEKKRNKSRFLGRDETRNICLKERIRKRSNSVEKIKECGKGHTSDSSERSPNSWSLVRKDRHQFNSSHHSRCLNSRSPERRGRNRSKCRSTSVSLERQHEYQHNASHQSRSRDSRSPDSKKSKCISTCGSQERKDDARHTTSYSPSPEIRGRNRSGSMDRNRGFKSYSRLESSDKWDEKVESSRKNRESRKSERLDSSYGRTSRSGSLSDRQGEYRPSVRSYVTKRSEDTTYYDRTKYETSWSRHSETEHRKSDYDDGRRRNEGRRRDGDDHTRGSPYNRENRNDRFDMRERLSGSRSGEGRRRDDHRKY